MRSLDQVRRRITSVNIRDVGSTTAIDILMMAMQLLTGIIVGRVLGPSGRGEFAMIILWPAFISGLMIGGLRFSLIYHVSRKIGKLSNTIATAVITMVVGSAIAAALLVVFAEDWLPAASPQVHDLLILTSLLLPIASIGTILEPVLLGQRKYKAWNFLRVLDPILMVASVLAFAWFGLLSVASLIYLYLAIRLFYTAWFLLYVKREFPSMEVDSVARGLLVYGAKCQPSGWLGNVNAQADQLILSSLFTPMFLGLYRTGANVASFLRFVFIGFQRLVMTEAAECEEEWQRIDRIANYLAMCLLVSLISVGPFLLILGPAIRWMYGEAFDGSVAPAQVLVFAIILRGFCGILGNGFRGLGKPLLPLWADVTGAVILLVSFVLLIPPMGIMGAATSVVISSASVFVVLGIAFLRCYFGQRRKPASEDDSGTQLISEKRLVKE